MTNFDKIIAEANQILSEQEMTPEQMAQMQAAPPPRTGAHDQADKEEISPEEEGDLDTQAVVIGLVELARKAFMTGLYTQPENVNNIVTRDEYDKIIKSTTPDSADQIREILSRIVSDNYMDTGL